MNTDDKLQELIGKFDVGMLITHDEGGMAARPMNVAEHDEQSGELLFVTSMETGKVDEILAGADTAVVFQDSTRYVSLSGEAVISNDREKIKALFNKGWELWFPEGPEQEDIRLIRFTPVIGEYWDMSGARGARFVWQAGKALISGEGIKTEDRMQHAETTV